MSSFQRIDDEFFIGTQLTEKDLQATKLQGIRTVIDFRLRSETAMPALPVDQIGELDRAIKDHAGPFLLHCATDARAALLPSLSRAKQHGWSAEQTLSEAQRLGFDLKTSAEFSGFVRRTVG